MKNINNKIKRTVAVLLVVISMFSFTGCLGIVSTVIDLMNMSSDYAKGFFEAVSNENWIEASQYLRDDSVPTASALEYYIERTEAEYGVNFSNATKISITGTSMNVSGGCKDLEIDLELTLGSKVLDVEIIVRSDSQDFGIYSLDFD